MMMMRASCFNNASDSDVWLAQVADMKRRLEALLFTDSLPFHLISSRKRVRKNKKREDLSRDDDELILILNNNNNKHWLRYTAALWFG